MSAVPDPDRVAAVVVHWRNPADTERCLRSLLAPGGPGRVVLVDNGSRGADAAPAAPFRDEPRVELLRLPRNRGFAGGANAGVRRALEGGAEAVLLLNSDAVLEPGALAVLAAVLGADPRTAAAGPRILRDDGSGRAWFAGGAVAPAFGQVTHAAGDPGPGAPPRNAEFLTFCAVLLRRAAWEEVGPLEEEYFAYGEDADWCLRARRAGRTLAHCPAAVARHRVNGTVGTGTPLQAYLLARARVLLARRHAGAAARRIVFWPWLLLVRAPHDFLRSLATRGWAAAAAGVRGIRDGARGGPPRGFLEELGLAGDGGPA